MDNQLRISINAWDEQESRRLRQLAQERAYIDLNNLYLRVERGQINMSVTVSNSLNVLAGQAYDIDDPMRDWWRAEFDKLPGYRNY